MAQIPCWFVCNAKTRTPGDVRWAGPCRAPASTADGTSEPSARRPKSQQTRMLCLRSPCESGSRRCRERRGREWSRPRWCRRRSSGRDSCDSSIRRAAWSRSAIASSRCLRIRRRHAVRTYRVRRHGYTPQNSNAAAHQLPRSTRAAGYTPYHRHRCSEPRSPSSLTCCICCG